MTLVSTRSGPARRRGRTVVTYVETVESARPVTLGPADRHLVKRFSGGLTPALASQVKKAGGARAWFEKQLRPARIADAPGDDVDTWFPSLRLTPKQVFTADQNGDLGSWEVATDLSRWTVARRIASNRQLQEVMVDFWSNLLNVSLFHDEAIFWRMDYDRVIRAHALTTFEQLLQATITHPAMGLYLDNAYSSKDSPNENLGRELLELHTVGVDGGYTEDHVKASARMLTGYRVDIWDDFQAYYDKSWHDTQPVQILGFHHANNAADGRAATTALLSYLAKHPATADRIAQRLCAKFVSDQPTPAIVAAVAKAYRDNDTAIQPTLRALVDHPDFAAGAGQGPHADRGLRRHRASAGHQAAGSDVRRLVRQRHVLAVQRGRAAAVRVVDAGRLPRGRPVVGRRRTVAYRLHDAPGPGCPLVAHRPGPVPEDGIAAAADAGDPRQGRRPRRRADARSEAAGIGPQRDRPAAGDVAHDQPHPGRRARVLDTARHPLVPARLTPAPAPLARSSKEPR